MTLVNIVNKVSHRVKPLLHITALHLELFKSLSNVIGVLFTPVVAHFGHFCYLSNDTLIIVIERGIGR